MNKIKDTEELSKYESEFTAEKFWDKLAKFASKIGRVPVYYALVLYYVLESPTVSLKNKAVILGALGYLILPIDLVPDLIPVAGFVDDAAALKLAYEAVKTSVTPQIEKQAQDKLSQWFDN